MRWEREVIATTKANTCKWPSGMKARQTNSKLQAFPNGVKFQDDIYNVQNQKLGVFEFNFKFCLFIIMAHFQIER